MRRERTRAEGGLLRLRATHTVDAGAPRGNDARMGRMRRRTLTSSDVAPAAWPSGQRRHRVVVVVLLLRQRLGRCRRRRLAAVSPQPRRAARGWQGAAHSAGIA